MDRVTTLKQETFDEVVAKAAAKNFAPSYLADDEGTCAYRGAGEYDGLRCNVGMLIPDERYSGAIEGSDLYTRPEIWELTTVYDACNERGFNRVDRDEMLSFLRCLQGAHDGCVQGGEHKDALRAVARRECLLIPEALR